MSSEEDALLADPRLAKAINLFNSGDWYACHDGFEELWHETAGPLRPALQGILQIAVSQLHRQRDNLRGATILMGEGLGRLKSCDAVVLGLDVSALRIAAARHLDVLQQQSSTDANALPPLRLNRIAVGDEPIQGVGDL